ncbi:MAG TPA: aminodeoxychorismate/anthranilate synthase component II [Tenuifilaceae bacterium]|nr:aminodeoxychorismate/anthranilate synthase component II [Tenuifilaceae bacterium]
MRILVIDNYDSFTYNLVHYVQEYPNCEVDVCRNDAIDFGAVGSYDGIILSPGPGLPSQSGDLLVLIEQYQQQKPILGVCLGQQAIAQAFGGELENLERVYHGEASAIDSIGNKHFLFNGVPHRFVVGRYHSWVVKKDTLPPCLQVNAIDSNGCIMALSHRELDICGVQFHPESILTQEGKRMIFNWLDHVALHC